MRQTSQVYYTGIRDGVLYVMMSSLSISSQWSQFKLNIFLSSDFYSYKHHDGVMSLILSSFCMDSLIILYQRKTVFASRRHLYVYSN